MAARAAHRRASARCANGQAPPSLFASLLALRWAGVRPCGRLGVWPCGGLGVWPFEGHGVWPFGGLSAWARGRAGRLWRSGRLEAWPCGGLGVRPCGGLTGSKGRSRVFRRAWRAGSPREESSAWRWAELQHFEGPKCCPAMGGRWAFRRRMNCRARCRGPACSAGLVRPQVLSALSPGMPETPTRLTAPDFRDGGLAGLSARVCSALMGALEPLAYGQAWVLGCLQGAGSLVLAGVLGVRHTVEERQARDTLARLRGGLRQGEEVSAKARPAGVLSLPLRDCLPLPLLMTAPGALEPLTGGAEGPACDGMERWSGGGCVALGGAPSCKLRPGAGLLAGGSGTPGGGIAWLSWDRGGGAWPLLALPLWVPSS
ncbi:hypothetical protein D3C71_18460 [compost metagenome]